MPMEWELVADGQGGRKVFGEIKELCLAIILGFQTNCRMYQMVVSIWLSFLPFRCWAIGMEYGIFLYWRWIVWIHLSANNVPMCLPCFPCWAVCAVGVCDTTLLWFIGFWCVGMVRMRRVCLLVLMHCQCFCHHVGFGPVCVLVAGEVIVFWRWGFWCWCCWVG